jgi:Zn-dependent protease
MFSGNFDITLFLRYFARIVTLLLVIPVHESAHALMAKWLGDDTAMRQGRISLNPFVHIDPLGAILMIVGGFGWAKPVPVNPVRMKHYPSGFALTALAGPVSNLIAAFLSALAFAIIVSTEKGVNAFYEQFSGSSSTLYCVILLLEFLFQVNVGLAVFNLIPVPPLDGFNILRAFTPEKFDRWVYQHQREINFTFFALLIIINIVPTRFSPLYHVTSALCDLLWKTVSWIPAAKWGY